MTETASIRPSSFWAESAPSPWSPRRNILELAAVFIAGAVVMTFIYAGTGGVNGDEIGVPGNDSFYHTKMAMLLPEIGLVDTFPWLTTTIFAEKFVSHHYGFHLLLVPFIKASEWFADGDPLRGARWAITFCFATAVLLFDLLLLAGRVRYRPIWWVMFLLMPHQFFGRQVFIRAICPSLVFILLLLLAMFRRRYVLAGVIVFLYTQLYLGSVVYSPVLVGAFFIAGLLGPRGDRISWKLPVYTAAGWLMGLVLHPYGGWDAVEFLRLQVLGTGLNPDIPVGREWKSYSPAWFFVQMSGVTLLLSAVSVCLRFRCGRRLDAQELALLILSFVFLGLTLKARRFIEYWPVFSVLSSAYLCAPLLTRHGFATDAHESDKPPPPRDGLQLDGLQLVGMAVFLVGVSSLCVVVAKRLGVTRFAAEWRVWVWLIGALSLAPICRVWRAGRGRSFLASLAGIWLTAAVVAGIVLGVGAWSLAGQSLPAPKIQVGWLWAVLVVAYLLAPFLTRRTSRDESVQDAAATMTRAAGLVLGGAGLSLVCFVFVSPALVALQDNSRCGFQLAAVRDAMDYLKANSELNDIVFTDDWDIFGLFFFYNHHNRYIVGLDPKFTHARDPELWDRYTRITQAKTPSTINVERTDKDGQTHTEKARVTLGDIRKYFLADWIIVDEDHRSLARKLLAAPKVAKRVYTSPFKTKRKVPRYEIYRVLSPTDAN